MIFGIGQIVKLLFLDDNVDRHKRFYEREDAYNNNQSIVDGLTRHEPFVSLTYDDEGTIQTTHVFTSRQAIEALAAEQFDVVSLDHDLGPANTESSNRRTFIDIGFITDSGMKVVDYMTEMPSENRPEFTIVHSWNFVAAKEMISMLEDCGFRCEYRRFSE